MRQIVLIIHNIRSAHNVGSLLRTADGLGIEKVIISGYSPYPQDKSDSRLPHLANKTHRSIRKTALGAESSVVWEHVEKPEGRIEKLKSEGYVLAALEQTATATALNQYVAPHKITLLVGSEIGGVELGLLNTADVHLQIPMFGSKESFNVAVAGAIALYQLRFAQ